MKKFIVIIIICMLFKHSSFAQQALNLDSTLSRFVENLNLSEVKSGLLLERGFPFEQLKTYDGTKNNNSITLADFHYSYMALATMHTNGKSLIPHIALLQKQINQTADMPINIGALYFNYHAITDSALEKGMAKISNGSLSDLTGNKTSLYTSHTCFLFSPLAKGSTSLQNEFVFSYDCFFSNINMKNIEIKNGCSLEIKAYSSFKIENNFNAKAGTTLTIGNY